MAPPTSPPPAGSGASKTDPTALAPAHAPHVIASEREMNDTLALLLRRSMDVFEVQLPFIQKQITMLSDILRAQARPSLPDPELTPTGGFRFDPKQWQDILARIGAYEAKIDAYEQEKAISEAEMRGAKQAIQKIEADSAEKLKKLTKAVKVLVAALPIIAAIATLLARFWK